MAAVDKRDAPHAAELVVLLERFANASRKAVRARRADDSAKERGRHSADRLRGLHGDPTLTRIAHDVIVRIDAHAAGERTLFLAHDPQDRLAVVLVLPTIGLNLVVFRYVPRTWASGLVSGAMAAWACMNVLWMVHDFGMFRWGLAAGKAFLVLGRSWSSSP